MMKMKRLAGSILTGAVILAMLTVLFCGSAALAGSEGTCGENLAWTLNDEGVLTVTGTGDMSDNPVWPVSEIRQAIIGAGVTSIGSYAFYGCGNLETVRIPGSASSATASSGNSGTVSIHSSVRVVSYHPSIHTQAAGVPFGRIP